MNWSYTIAANVFAHITVRILVCLRVVGYESLRDGVYAVSAVKGSLADMFLSLLQPFVVSSLSLFVLSIMLF